MTQPTRAAILAALSERRGLHKSELRRLVGIGWGNLGHHLRVLEDEGLVQLEGRGRLTWVFAATVPRAERDLLVATRPSAARRLLEAIGVRDRVTVGSLSQELDLSKKVIRRHLGALARAGAVERSAGHPPSFAKPTPPPARPCPECPLDPQRTGGLEAGRRR
jgi:DNA-binding transcriptional ArsR family regulator